VAKRIVYDVEYDAKKRDWKVLAEGAWRASLRAPTQGSRGQGGDRAGEGQAAVPSPDQDEGRPDPDRAYVPTTQRPGAVPGLAPSSRM
jgi:hypothetical protein